MKLKLGQQQMHTSKRMLAYPKIGKVVSTLFGYTNLGNYARFSIFKKMLKSMPVQNFDKILDLGCGYGEYSMGLATSLPEAEIHALDIDQKRTKVVQEATEKNGLTNVVVHNSFIEEVKESEYDFIFSVDVFEHIDPIEMPFTQCYEKLKSGGYFIVKIPNVVQRTIFPEAWFSDHHDWLEDEHIGQVYDLEKLSARFEASGFNIVSKFYSDGLLSRLGWEFAYLGKKMGTIMHLISLPVSKALIKMDRLVHQGYWGNAIQVIGQKP